MIQLLLGFALAIVLTTSAQAASSPRDDLVRVWYDLNVMCRGGSGDAPSTAQACEVRTKGCARWDIAGI
jgi:hypothetical protein